MEDDTLIRLRNQLDQLNGKSVIAKPFYSGMMWPAIYALIVFTIIVFVLYTTKPSVIYSGYDISPVRLISLSAIICGIIVGLYFIYDKFIAQNWA